MSARQEALHRFSENQDHVRSAVHYAVSSSWGLLGCECITLTLIALTHQCTVQRLVQCAHSQAAALPCVEFSVFATQLKYNSKATDGT
jgi:hypothetical protein